MRSEKCAGFVGRWTDCQSLQSHENRGKVFDPGKSDDAVNRMPVNRMMTVLHIVKTSNLKESFNPRR